MINKVKLLHYQGIVPLLLGVSRYFCITFALKERINHINNKV